MQPLLQWESSKYSITYCECVFVAVGVLCAMRTRLIICGLSGSTTFFALYLINGAILEENLWDIKCVF